MPSINPGFVIPKFNILAPAAQHIQGGTKHFGIAHIVDHHIIMAGNDDFGIDIADNPGGVHVAKIVEATVDADGANINVEAIYPGEKIALGSITGIVEGDAAADFHQVAHVV